LNKTVLEAHPALRTIRAIWLTSFDFAFPFWVAPLAGFLGMMIVS